MPMPPVTRKELQGELDAFFKELRASIRDDLRDELQQQLGAGGRWMTEAENRTQPPAGYADRDDDENDDGNGHVVLNGIDSKTIDCEMSRSSTAQMRKSKSGGMFWRGHKHEVFDRHHPQELVQEDGEAITVPGSARDLDYNLLPQLSAIGIVPDNVYSSLCAMVQEWAQPVVNNRVFEIIASTVVALNCLEIGIEADARAQGRAYEESKLIGQMFCIVFCMELSLRMCSVGITDYFSGSNWNWNLFDCIVVAIQVIDQVTNGLPEKQRGVIADFTVLRLLRLVRILRLLRLVKMVSDLKTIFSAMVNAFSALTWTMMLLLMLMYILSILCIEVISKAQETRELKHDVELKYFFGSLSRSMLTMFECIVGGISWDEVVAPLAEDVSPFMAIAIILYIIISCYAVTNMMTGMFVQKAMQFATDNQELSEAENLKVLCFDSNQDGIASSEELEEISWEKFEVMSRRPEMLEYFKSLNVCPSEARRLFDLLDTDGGGMLDAEELVTGCLRLRGPAKALDLCLAMKEIDTIHCRLDEFLSKHGH